MDFTGKLGLFKIRNVSELDLQKCHEIRSNMFKNRIDITIGMAHQILKNANSKHKLPITCICKEAILLKDSYSFPDDINRIRYALSKIGYDICIDNAENLWTIYSDKAFAGWLNLPEDDSKLIEVLVEFLIEYEES